jgi:hypothetical protein
MPMGGSLRVFLDSRGLSTGQMLQITRKLRHFEAMSPSSGAALSRHGRPECIARESDVR